MARTNGIILTIIRTTYLFLLLLALTRLIGRKLISQMTFFDFMIGITIGPVGAHLALGKSLTLSNGLTVLTVLSVLSILTALITIRSTNLRKTIDSEPVIMIANGKIVRKNMKKVRLTLNDLLMMLREKSAFNINDVEFALMETDGKLSVLKKSRQEPLTPSDFKIPTKYKGLTKDLVIDGQVQTENLRDINLDPVWLEKELHVMGYSDPAELFYVGLDTEGKLFVSAKRLSQSEEPGKYGME